MSSLDDKQADIKEIRDQIEELLKMLESAESCESEKDFFSNLNEALLQVSGIKSDLRGLL